MLLIYALLLLLLIHLYFRLATRFDIVDEPGERSSHFRPVIRGAGIIFPVGILLWFVWSGFQYPWFVTGLLLISLVSFLDDLSHVLRGIRLSVQVAGIALLLIQAGFTGMPWWVWAFTLFFATGVLNAFNFMDGINGMTAGFSLSVLLSLWFVNRFMVPFVADDLLYAAGIAVIIFGWYNFRIHARCFAGDVGPVSIAFILLFLTFRLILASGDPVYLMFLSLYGIDTFFTLIRRIVNGENILLPHRQHLYQTLTNDNGFSHVTVSAGLAAGQLMLNAVVLTMTWFLAIPLTLWLSALLLVLLSAAYILVKIRLLHNPSG